MSASTGNNEYLKILNQSSFFGLLDHNLLAEIAHYLKPRLFGPGDYVMEQGQEPDGVYILAEGRVQITHNDKSVDEDGEKGSLLGEMAVIFDEKRFASVQAMSPISTLFLPLDVLRELFEMHEVLKERVTLQARQRRFKLNVETVKSNRQRLSRCRNRVLALKLRNLKFFQKIQTQFIEELAAQLERVTASEGDVLIQQGEAGDAMYIISRGYLEAADQKTGVSYRVMEAGDIFGELALLQDSPRTAQVTATSNCELYKLKREHFQQMVSREPAVAAVVSEIASQREFFSGNRV